MAREHREAPHSTQAEIELSRLHRRLRLCARPDVATFSSLDHCLPPHDTCTRNQPQSSRGVNHWTGTGPASTGPCNSWPLHQLALHQLALQLQPLARPVIYPRPDGQMG